MSAELYVLALSAASVAFVHTLLGPDHYLPFVAMGEARGWSVGRTVRITLLCGLGHLLGSVVLGAVGIALGTQLGRLARVEGLRGELAAWALLGFGLAYTAWGLRRALHRRSHAHWHRHGSIVHCHAHDHRGDHAHLHRSGQGRGGLTPWLIFMIFILGPCEPLVPLLMYPAATYSVAGVVAVSGVFGIVTVVTMVGAVVLSKLGLRSMRWRGTAGFEHALAGFAIFACGSGMMWFGW